MQADRKESVVYWVYRAAHALDCAVQLGAGEEIAAIEERLDEIAKEMSWKN